jgi:hypothetical protein
MVKNEVADDAKTMKFPSCVTIRMRVMQIIIDDAIIWAKIAPPKISWISAQNLIRQKNLCS